MKRVLVYGMTDNPGGIESYLLSIIERASERGIQLDFVTDFPSIAHEEVLKQQNARIYYIPAKGKKLVQHMLGLWKILREHPEYETVYFNILDAGAAITMLVPYFLRRKRVVHSHNGSTDKERLHMLCQPLLNKMTNEYVACSKLAAEFMFGNKICSKKEILIVPNAIDVEKYNFNLDKRNTYREKLQVQDNLVICHVGRITRQKNPFRLIDIFSSLHDREPKSVLLYIGTGDLEQEIKNYVQEKNLQNAVLFLGKRNDVAEIMQASDIFLLPSLYEGLPIVAVEAQAAGLPVILSSNITTETDLTGLLKFVSLEDKDTIWVEKILESSKVERKHYQDVIAKEGYSKNGDDSRVEKLIDMLR